MSETLKFGNGQWATKVGSTLAYNDEGGNFKPLPFTFTRSTGGTRVNKDGLIEVVSNNKPRIDFLNDSNGALLLEPTRSNLVTHSEDFSNASWTTNNATISVNQIISPDGTLNADKITEDSSNTDHKTRDTIVFSNGTYTWSVLAKADERDFVAINVFDGTTLFGYTFDLLNGSLGSLVSGSGSVDANIENYGSGWYRCSISFTASSGTGQANVGAALNSTTISYQGDGTSGLYIWGAQLEAGSYATSYIPTQGATATRVAEVCEQNLSNQVSLTEGVFYVDVTNLGRTQNANILTQNSTSNSVYGYIQTNNRIVFGLFANSVSVPITSSLEYEIGTRTKIAFHYKSGNSKLYVNGSLVGNSTDTFTIGSGFADAIRLIDNSSSYFAFPEKSILQEFKIYNTSLTDLQLQQLTTL